MQMRKQLSRNQLFEILIQVASLMFLLVIAQGCGSDEPKIDALPDFHNINGKPYLLLAQQPGTSNQPASIKNYIDHIESMPFEGMFIHLVPFSWLVMKGDSLIYDDIADKLLPIQDIFTTFQYNFLYVFIDFPGDLWDDEVWEITARNFALMARAARDYGMKGIIYDNEEYQDGRWINFGEDYQNPDYALEEHANKTILRGKQVMEAMVVEFPDIEVMHYHGPYLSEPRTSIPAVVMMQAASWDHYELLGPFFAGMVLGKGNRGTVIDGGEVYQYRTMNDFEYSYQVRKYDIASEGTDCWFIPLELRPNWSSDVNISFGVYNLHWIPKYPMDPSIMRTTLFNALSVTDKYVWYYTQEDDWLIPKQMPEEWIDVVREVHNKVIGSD
jgi:hypothetical protein